MTDKRTTWKINASKGEPNWLIVIGPFDESFVSAIKTRIPVPYRRFDDVLKAWKVHSNYRRRLEMIIEAHSSSADEQPSEVPVAEQDAAGHIDLIMRRAALVGPEASSDVHDHVAEGLMLGGSEALGIHLSVCELERFEVREVTVEGRRKLVICAVLSEEST